MATGIPVDTTPEKPGPCVADDLARDPRIQRARALYLEALRDHTRRIQRPRAPDPDRALSYQACIDQVGQLRGRPLFFPYLSSGLGNGALVELADGSVKYDLISGIGVHALGHSHPGLVAASLDAALQDTVMQGNLQQHRVEAGFSRLLRAIACRKGAELDHCFLTTSGAMANENGLKILFQHRAPADRILSFRGSFFGRSLYLAQVTDRPEYRRGLPATAQVDYLPFYDERRPGPSTRDALKRLDEYLAAGAERYAAVLVELVLGEGGSYPGHPDFFRPIFDRLRAHGIPVMIDEIQTFGRTPELFAYQYFDLDDYVDVVSVGKMTQVCATLFRSSVNPDPGLVSQTFTSSTSALAAGKVVLEELLGGNYYGPSGKIAQMHRFVAGRLQSLHQSHPRWISGPFGIGAMVAFTPFDGSPEVVKRCLLKLFDAGVLAFSAGHDPCRIRFLLPFAAMGYAELEQVIGILRHVLHDLDDGSI